MKKKFKFLSLILTLVLSLSLSACIVTDGYVGGSTGGSGGSNYGSGALEVSINTSTGAENLYTSLTEMLDNVRPAVLEVYAKSEGSQAVSSGSGVIIAKTTKSSIDYYHVLTCHHIISGADVIMAKDIYGNEFTLSLIGGDPDSDIAIVELCPKNDNYKPENVKIKVASVRVNEGSNYPLKVGEDVVAIGNPLGTLGGTVTRGIISSTDREVKVENQVMKLIQTDCSINAGNSGGGLFDMNGNLVGVVNAGYQGLQGLNFAIPTDQALDISEKLMETYFNTGSKYNYGYVEGRAMVAVENASRLSFGFELAIADYRASIFEVYYSCVLGVKKGSIYDAAGIEVGDRIKSVTFKNETYSATYGADLVAYLNSLKVAKGDQIKFSIIKNNTNQVQEVTMTFRQYIYGDTGYTK